MTVIEYLNSHRRVLLIVSLLAVVGLLILTFFTFSASQKPIIKTAPNADNKISSLESLPKGTNLGLPASLLIPKIKVTASIEFVGLDTAGNMAVPTNIIDVGWYKYGPLPGNKGSAVIDGHVDGPRGQPAVFANLDKLRPGDNLMIVDSKGQTITFVVRKTQTFSQSDKPSEVFNSSDGIHLNLITCAGAWDATQHHFTERLVVFADKSS